MYQRGLAAAPILIDESSIPIPQSSRWRKARFLNSLLRIQHYCVPFDLVLAPRQV